MKFAEFIAMNYSPFDKVLRKNFTTERVKQIYAISDEFASKLSNQGEQPSEPSEEVGECYQRGYNQGYEDGRAEGKTIF